MVIFKHPKRSVHAYAPLYAAVDWYVPPKTHVKDKNEVKHPTNIHGMEQNDHSVLNTDRKLGDMPGDNSNPTKEGLSTGRPWGSMSSSICEFPRATFSRKGSFAAPDLQTCAGNRFENHG